MIFVYLGTILFAGTHLFSMLMPNQRDALKGRLGEQAFKGVYSAASLIGIGLLVYGYSSAWASGTGVTPVFDPPSWGRHATMLLVWLGFIAIAASHGKGQIKSLLRNPMSIGISLWAFGHLLANGLWLDLWLFGTFLLIGVLDILLSTLRGKVPGHAPRSRSDVIAVVAGTAVYAVFLFGFHPHILGVPVLR
jgi:uncharacterized membrane protein